MPKIKSIIKIAISILNANLAILKPSSFCLRSKIQDATHNMFIGIYRLFIRASALLVASRREKNGLCNINTKDSMKSPDRVNALYLLGIKKEGFIPLC